MSRCFFGCLLQLGILIVVAGAYVTAAFAAAGLGNGELQPIQATLPQPVAADSAATRVRVGHRSVSALPVLVRVDAPVAHAASESEQTTVPAYSLDLARASVPPSTEWSAASPGTPGIADARRPSWIVRPGQKDTIEPGNLELAARQIAIWHETNGLKIDRVTVRDTRVRRRALALARSAARAPKLTGRNPISFSITASVADVTTDQVTISILLGINGESSFCDAQKLDIRVNGRWGVVKTGVRSAVRNAGDAALKVRRLSNLPGVPCNAPGSPAQDFNEARFSLPRPTEGTSVEIDWNTNLNGVNLFRAGNGAPPIIVKGFGDHPKLQFRQTLPLDPDTFPTAHNYLERFLTSLLRSFHGITAIIVLLLLLGVAPLISQGFKALLTRAGQSVHGRYRTWRS